MFLNDSQALMSMSPKMGPMQGWESEWAGVGGFLQLEIPNFHFMFLKIWIPYSRCSRSDKTDLKDFRRAPFRLFSICEILRFPKKLFFNDSRFSGIVLSDLVGPKSRIMVSRGHGHVRQVQKSCKLRLIGNVTDPRTPFHRQPSHGLVTPWPSGVWSASATFLMHLRRKKTPTCL